MEISNIKHSSIILPNLTPLRAIAAMAVVVFHFNEILILFVTQQQTMLLRKCYLMVDLFFIMSGFIMLHVYRESFSNALNRKTFSKFIGARFARLYPLHLFTLIAAILLFNFSKAPVDPVTARIMDPMAIITNLLMLHSCGFHNIFTWNVPSWSISAEWWAYMLFPFLVLLLAKNKRAGIILMLLLSAAIYFSILYLLPRTNPFAPSVPYVGHDLDVTFDYGCLRGLAGFMLGMITYIAYQNKNILRFFFGDIVGLLCILVLLVIMHFGLNDVIYMPFFMILVLSFSKNEGIIHKICMIRPLQYLGDISYSIYMVHALVLFYFGDLFVKKMGFVFKENEAHQLPFYSGLWACFLFLVIIIFISSITYYLIEKPCRRWLNKKFA